MELRVRFIEKSDARIHKESISFPTLLTLIVITIRELSSLDDVILGLHDSSTKDLTLQMDIEGNEWMILRSLSINTLERFRVIILELHNLPLMREKVLFNIIVAPQLKKSLNLSVTPLPESMCRRGSLVLILKPGIQTP